MTAVVYPPVTAIADPARFKAYGKCWPADSGHHIRHPGFVAGCAAMSAILIPPARLDNRIQQGTWEVELPTDQGDDEAS